MPVGGGSPGASGRQPIRRPRPQSHEADTDGGYVTPAYPATHRPLPLADAASVIGLVPTTSDRVKRPRSERRPAFQRSVSAATDVEEHALVRHYHERATATAAPALLLAAAAAAWQTEPACLPAAACRSVRCSNSLSGGWMAGSLVVLLPPVDVRSQPQIDRRRLTP